MYKENDNLNMEEIERYRKMTQEERDELMAEQEKEILKEIKKSKERKDWKQQIMTLMQFRQK